MASLHLLLLGSPKVIVVGRTIEVRRRKAAALLYYLALQGRRQQRDHLTALLFEEDSTKSARRHLRVMLHHLVQELGLADFLESTTETIGWQSGVVVTVDVHQFQEALTAFTPGDDPAPLQRAADLYRGELLTGFTIPGSLQFEEWLGLEREQLHRQSIRALTLLMEEYARRSDYGRGVLAAQRLLALEPWHEETHRHLMLLLAQDGQHRAALAQYETCYQILADELGAEPMPETRALYQRLQAATILPTHNLPLQTTAFVGRTDELALLTHTLQQVDCRLLTVLGMGGAGKTRLALQAAAQFVTPGDHLVEQPFPDGVFYTPLVGISAPALDTPAALRETINRIAIAIGQIFEMTFTGQIEPADQVAAFLRPKRLLLLLDNWEHLRSANPLLHTLLQCAPDITLLVTSRERLHLDEEWSLDIAGLPIPKTPNDIDQAAASVLLIQEARRARLDLHVSVADAWHIVRICRLVEGLPLALKLAASSLRNTTWAALATDILQTLDALETTTSNIPERHRSMRAVLDYSWRTLSPDEQALLRRIAVFHGGFDQEAAATVAQVSSNRLGNLIDKSLLDLAPQGRYTIHELVRQFAADQLAVAATETTQTAKRHAHYYARQLATRTVNLGIELDNIRAAWGWAAQEVQLSLLNEMRQPLATFYELGGLLQEGEAAFAQAVASTDLDQDETVLEMIPFWLLLARFIGLRSDYQRALALLEQIAPVLASTQDGLVFYRIYTEQRGWLLANQGHYAEAERFIMPALEQSMQACDHFGEARARFHLGGIARRQGNYVQAGEELTTAQTLLEQLPAQAETTRLLAEIATELGVVHSRQGRPEAARTAYQQALQLSRRSSDRLRESVALNHLGAIAYEQRDLRSAHDYHQQALALRWQMGDRAGEATSRYNLALIDHGLGSYSAARAGLEAALSICEEIQDRWGAVNVWNVLGILALELGDLAAARDALQHGKVLSEEIGDEAGQTYILANLGLTLYEQEQLVEAEQILQMGLMLARDQADEDLVATFHTYLAFVYLKQGKLDLAEQNAYTAYELHQRLQQIPLTIDDLSLIALAALAQLDLPRALTLAREVYELLDGCGGEGPEFPQLDYFACYQVFQAADDEVAASHTLAAAVHIVEQRAARIAETDIRESFRSRVAINRQILETHALKTAHSQ